MKVQIPDELKQDAPKNHWGKVLTATPVIMTVVATMLAGLASSEMTRAQYSRSLGAQQQAKAGDQWGFFQAKRLRSALQRTTVDLLRSTAEVRPLSSYPGGKVDPLAAPGLLRGEIPELAPEPQIGADIKAALNLLLAAKPEADIADALAGTKPEALVDAMRAARARADDFDIATKPGNQAMDAMEKSLSNEGREWVRDFTSARARYAAARYDAEARLNQAVAELIELQVRKSNVIAERHHRRSQRFFFGMLGAQAAVIVSTFSLAAKQRSVLWTLAAAAGITAIAFAIYVYFYV